MGAPRHETRGGCRFWLYRGWSASAPSLDADAKEPRKKRNKERKKKRHCSRRTTKACPIIRPPFSVHPLSGSEQLDGLWLHVVVGIHRLHHQRQGLARLLQLRRHWNIGLPQGPQCWNERLGKVELACKGRVRLGIGTFHVPHQEDVVKSEWPTCWRCQGAIRPVTSSSGGVRVLGRSNGMKAKTLSPRWGSPHQQDQTPNINRSCNQTLLLRSKTLPVVAFQYIIYI